MFFYQRSNAFLKKILDKFQISYFTVIFLMSARINIRVVHWDYGESLITGLKGIISAVSKTFIQTGELVLL